MPYKDPEDARKYRRANLKRRRENLRAWHRKHPGKHMEYYRRSKAKDPKRFLAAARRRGHKWNLLHPEIKLLVAARKRAGYSGCPFNIEVSDVVIPEYCPIFNIPLRHASGKPRHNSPSLDKIIPEKGYTKGNVWVISWKANRLKNDASPEELMRLAIAVQEKANATR